MLRYKTETRPGLVALYDIRQEMERVNSYNPGVRTGPTYPWVICIKLGRKPLTSSREACPDTQTTVYMHHTQLRAPLYNFKLYRIYLTLPTSHC